MGQKNIIQLPAVLSLPGNLKTGINIFGDKAGIYMSKDIDFDTDAEGIRAQQRPTADMTTGTLATFNDGPRWMAKADSNKIFLITDANEIFQRSAGVWSRVNVSGETGSGQGLVEYGDDLFYVQTTYVGYFDGATWDDNWQTRSTAQSTYGPAIKFIGKMMVGSGRYVDTWDGVTWKQADLTLPINEVISSFTVWNDLLVIGCNSGNIYFWDGTSEVYNDVKMVPDGAVVYAVKEMLNVLYVIAGRVATVYVFDGSNFIRKSIMPDVRDESFSGANVDITPGAVTVWQDKLLFLVELNTSINSIRTKSGVWSYSPATDRFNLEFTVSSGQMGTDLSGGALLFDSATESLYIGYEDNNAGSAGAYVDILTTTSNDTDEGNYLITDQLLPAEFALAFIRRFYLNASRLPSSAGGAKMIIAARYDEQELVLGSLLASTGSTGTKITTGSNVALVEVGDMIEIIAGPSARDIRFITAVDNNASPKELTVSESFSTTPVNAQTTFNIYRYRKIGELIPADALTLKSFEILQECSKLWIYIEIRGLANTTGERMTFKKGSIDYVQRPNS